jgi:hypothetical protein
MTDLGLPDGANLALVFRPGSWGRIHAAGGTNTASLGFRGGITLIPIWLWFVAPSLNFEGGFCRIGDMNSVLRAIFQVPSWLQNYAQQLGYSYYNAHVGLEFGRGRVTGFLHAGASYLHGTVRTPSPVRIAPVTGSPYVASAGDAQFYLRQDATFQAYTISFKAGIIVFLGERR